MKDLHQRSAPYEDAEITTSLTRNILNFSREFFDAAGSVILSSMPRPSLRWVPLTRGHRIRLETHFTVFPQALAGGIR